MGFSADAHAPKSFTFFGPSNVISSVGSDFGRTGGGELAVADPEADAVAVADSVGVALAVDPLGVALALDEPGPGSAPQAASKLVAAADEIPRRASR